MVAIRPNFNEGDEVYYNNRPAEIMEINGNTVKIMFMDNEPGQVFMNVSIYQLRPRNNPVGGKRRRSRRTRRTRRRSTKRRQLRRS